MTSCQRNGSAMASLAATRTRCANTWEPYRFASEPRERDRGEPDIRTAGLLIVHPPLLQPELEERDDPDDHQDGQRDRRREALVVADEAGLVEVEDERLGGRHDRVVGPE